MKEKLGKKKLKVGSNTFDIYAIRELEQKFGSVDHLPYSSKVLLENLLRNLDGKTTTLEMLENVIKGKVGEEISFKPSRVLMQDFTGVPAVVDLAAMRDAMEKLGGDIKKINPLAPVDLVIDHSVMVDYYGSGTAFGKNVKMEFGRNAERYEFLRWGQQAFDNFRVVPPGTGICHQVNLEYLAKVVFLGANGTAYLDTVVGTDSHTTMVNSLGVLGWGVGGIEAEAAMLGQASSMLIPEVIGLKLTGSLKEGVTATDLVLSVTEVLRKRGVVEKFVEFCGSGLSNLTLADRATISNMAPEYGATCGIFPVDQETINYLKLTNREDKQIDLIESYMREQGMWHDESSKDPKFNDLLELDLNEVEPSLAGPKRPQDRVTLSQVPKAFKEVKDTDITEYVSSVSDGSVVIAAITSCTNTSNPYVMVAAGLVAKKAIELGLKVKPWVKTSLAPGSQVVTDYLVSSGLDKSLDTLGFNLVGYGCTTCIGNSGPLDDDITKAVVDGNLSVAAVLSGNRNFEGRISPLVKANFLASPPLVVAYALAGSVLLDLSKDPVGVSDDGKDIFLKDIWPDSKEVAQIVKENVIPKIFAKRYSDVFKGTEDWQKVKSGKGDIYDWNVGSTYVKRPPYFDGMTLTLDKISDIKDARALLLLADSVTTDHISPAGSFKSDTPAGRYLLDRQIKPSDFNSFGARRGNHEIMMRGTFSNIRIRNEMLDNVEGGFTALMPEGEQTTVFDASVEYEKQGIPLIVIAGKEYGTGSSRDWAAKGAKLLGVKAVIAESFERIHRSNLIGMGVLPLEFTGGENRKSLKIDGSEEFSILGLEKLSRGDKLSLTIKRSSGKVDQAQLKCRIDTDLELEYYLNGGVLSYVLRHLC